MKTKHYSRPPRRYQPPRRSQPLRGERDWILLSELISKAAQSGKGVMIFSHKPTEMQLVYDRKKGIGLQKCYCDKDQGWSVFWSGKAGYEVSYDSAITRKPGFSVASDADLSECNNKINRFKEDILNAAKTNRKISKFVEKHRDEMEL